MKTEREEKSKNRRDGTNQKQPDGRFQYNYTNNYIKYKWSKNTN